MERWATDAVAVCCILAGGVAGVAVTRAALDRDARADEVSCAARAPAVGLSVIVEGGRRHATTVRSHAVPCVKLDERRLRAVRVELRERAGTERAREMRARADEMRVRADEMRARAEEMKVRAEAGRQALDAEREVLRQLERELSARARRLEREGGHRR